MLNFFTKITKFLGISTKTEKIGTKIVTQIVPDYVKLVIMVDNVYNRSQNLPLTPIKTVFIKNDYASMNADPVLHGLIRNIYIRRSYIGAIEAFKFVPGTAYDCSGMQTLCVVYAYELTENEKLLYAVEN